MELDQLRYFLQLAESRNFTRAAEALLISQPALSRSVQRLEEELGVPLLIRRSRKAELSDAGRLLKARAEQILALVDDAKLEICDDGKTGRIRIAAIPTIAPYFLPAFLKQFSHSFPEAVVEVYEDTTKDLLHQCAQGQIEIAIVAMPVNQPHLDVLELFTEELLLALPKRHPLAAQSSIRLKDIESEPFIVLDEPHCLSENILSFCRQRSFQPIIVGRTNQLSMVQELVSLSHGISMVPRMAQQIDQSSSRVYRSLAGSSPKRTIGMVWDPYRFQSRLVQACRTQLQEYCRDRY